MIFYPSKPKILIFITLIIGISIFSYMSSNDVRVLIIFFVVLGVILGISIKNITVIDSKIIFRYYFYEKIVLIKEISHMTKLDFFDYKAKIRVTMKNGDSVDFIRTPIFEDKIIDNLVRTVNTLSSFG